MKFTNRITYCKITFPHVGEVDFLKDLNIPVIFEPVLDETLDTAMIKLSDLRRADYPTVDVSKAFEPVSLVRIGFEDEDGNKQDTEIRMLIAHDDCKLQRKDDGPYKSWSHTIQLVEETKLLERESVDVLTFINPLERHYDAKADGEWTLDNNKSGYRDNSMIGVGAKTSDLDESLFLKYVGWQPQPLPMLIDKTDNYIFNNNLAGYNTDRTDKHDGGHDIKFFKLILTTPSNKTLTYEFPINGGLVEVSYNNNEYRYADSYLSIPLNQVGEYKIEYFLRANTDKNDGVGLRLTDVVYYTYIAVGSEEEQIHNYKISEVLNRTLNLTPLRHKDEQNKFEFDAEQLKEFELEESPEFAFTGHTLFEAMLIVAQYKGAFPKLKSRTVSFRTLWNGKVISESDLPEPIDDANSSDIDQYCTYLETEVQNLVGLNNSRIGTVIEPYAGGYKTTRSGGGSAISADTAVISTQYNMYQNIDLYMGMTNGVYIDKITPYVYEQGEYDGLSDRSGAYPNSKAYAVKWSQMGRNYTELAHRINSSASSIANSLTAPAISNIVYAKGGAVNSAAVEYIKNLFNVKENNSFAELMFRSEYVPIFNARIKQYKDCFAEFHHDGSIKYNQTAELVDSEMYGEHLKQLIRKIGNAVKRRTYIFDKIDDVPEVGTVVDGYSVYDIQMSVRENKVVATIFFVKYAELSKYIGVKNAWKDSDVSTNKCYNRAISYNEFLLFTNDGQKESTGKSVSAVALGGIVDYTSANPLTCVEATGHYIDGSNLNTVLLPVISLAIGNSLFFTWKYEDNYSAGYMSDKAPEGATSALSGTQYDRAQKAVRYCDMYGRMQTYDFKILKSGPVPNGSNIGWRKGDDEVEYSAEYVTRQIGYSLPLKPEELVGWQGEEFFSVKDLLVDKNSSEALTFSVQLHYCTDNENFIVGSGLTNFCSLVGGAAEEVALYGFKDRINIFNRRFPVGNATRLADISFTVNSSKKRIEINLPASINEYQAWALMGRDRNGNWQIIFGENRDFKGSEFKTELYLLPMHKLEDFI